MNTVTNILYWISTGLLIPVIIILLILFVRSLLTIGQFYGSYMSKLKFNKNFQHLVDEMTKENVHECLKNFDAKDKNSLGSRYLTKVTNSVASEAHYDRLLNEFEIASQKDMAVCQTLAKLGPLVGLMGTLIPMGPALVGLASGDVASMASNMQVAFATTVIGLFVGAVGFVVLQVKRRWFASDITELEFICELLKEHHENKSL